MISTKFKLKIKGIKKIFQYSFLELDVFRAIYQNRYENIGRWTKTNF